MKKKRKIIIILLSVAGFFCFCVCLAEELVNINTASLEDLDSLPGIGPSKAQAIIDYRDINGDFATSSDVMNVSGIGEATYKNIKDLIFVKPSPDSFFDKEIVLNEDELAEEETDGTATSTEEDVLDILEIEDEPIGIISEEYNLGDVLINEFCSDPADEEVEWVEIYNALNMEVDLDGWVLEEGSGARTSLEGVLVGSGDYKYLVVEKPKGNLNNKGDIIILRDNDDNLIDQIQYGDWHDGSSNAPVASDPYTVARKIDGYNTFNNSNDFVFTTTPTKGTPNIITEVGSDQEEAKSEKGQYDYSEYIIITEIYPNPFGSDSNASDDEQEFIELYNLGEREVSLDGWKLGDASTKRYVFDAITIKPKEYLAIRRSESKLALNNNSDSVKLFQGGLDNVFVEIKYEASKEGWSYALGSSSIWQWTEVPSPGKKNIIKTINNPPEVDFSFPEKVIKGTPILFDSSDTIDQDGDILGYLWDFGDGIILSLASPEHTFLYEGEFVVKLEVFDGKSTSTKEEIVSVLADGNEIGVASSSSVDIVLNEFLPNPEGSDQDGEWIEVKNISNEKQNLFSWSLDDSEGGSSSFVFDTDIWLDPGKLFIIDRAESGLALNNSIDRVRLFNPQGDLVEDVAYTEVEEGESYAKGENNKWFWSGVPSPGEENIISVSNNSDTLSYITAKTNAINIEEQTGIKEIKLEDIKNYESGELIKTQGTVAVLPGILGTQYFYIVGSPGIQVYSYKKNFPDLKVGDFIEVSGELAYYNGEQRLKISTIDDIKILEQREEPEPLAYPCEKICDDQVGELIRVSGEVVERKSSSVYLDDGTEEIQIYIKANTGISPTSIEEGSEIVVAGILSKTKTGLRLLPRSRDDIVMKDIESGAQEVGRVLGEIAVGDEWDIAQRDKKLELFKYLLLIATTIIVLLIGLLIKYK